MQYEIIMTDIGHTMQRDGEFIVFGDVMFALPNNGRSRISSYGEGPDKQSARHNLIDRAIEHLQREEDFNAEDNWNCNKCNYEWDAWKEGTEDGSCPKCGGFSGTSLNAETFAVDVIHRIAKGRQAGTMVNEYQCGECDSVYDNSSDATICCKAESFNAEADNFYRNCSKNGWSVLGRTMHYGCNVFGKVVGGASVVANNLNFYDKGSRKLRTAGMNKDFAPALELAKVSRELQPDTMDDWSRVAQVTNDRLSQNFSAETKSWRIQNRDSSGKFTKGFVEKIDIADFMELDPEAIPEISVSITYTPEQTIDFINSMINDDDLPMRLTDSSFVTSLQSHVSSADPELLEGLYAAAKLGLLEATMNADPIQITGSKRAVFVTELLLNYKWGQDYWAAEGQ